jgi:hypothetical protein
MLSRIPLLAMAVILNPLLAVPDDIKPVRELCFTHESATLKAAVGLQTAEGIVEGFGYGHVSATSGETWGYLQTYEGKAQDKTLTLSESSAVEGQIVTREVMFTLDGGSLVSADITYYSAPCGPIFEEYARRIAGK